MIHRVHDFFPARFAGAFIRHVGRAACVTCAVAAIASPVRSEVLADFDGSGLDFLFDNFQQTISPTTVRLQDTQNGWGGGVLNYAQPRDFTPFANEFFEVDFTVNPNHNTNLFTLELYDTAERSVKYNVPTTGGLIGQPQTFAISNPLGQPTGGTGQWWNFDFNNVTRLQVLGQWQSPGPFDITLDEIRVTGDAPPPYAGYQPDAPWRTEAAQRIDAIRKADLSLALTGADGLPLNGAAVRIKQQEHAFGFGTAVAINQILGTRTDDVLYREKLLDLGFNTVTIENGLKWEALEDWGPSFSFARNGQALDWLNANDLDVRGHVLVWPGVNNLPNYIDQMVADTRNNVPGAREALRQEVLDHIAEVAGFTLGRVVDWDVVNEIGTNRDLLEIFGESVMDEWFAAARAADPNAALAINEFNIISDQERSKRARYLQSIQGLISRGAEIDTIGFQGHFSASSLTDIAPGNDPQTVWDILDQFHDATGLPITITEYDLDTTNEALKAAYLRDFLTAVFAHEGVNEFIMWGFWEGRHWRPDAAMINQDWTETEMAAVWRDLVLNQWWTDEQLVTQADGSLDLRVFQGDYLIEVDVDGETLTYRFSIGPDGYRLIESFAASLPGDFDGNGAVDQGDLDLVLNNWGQDPGNAVPANWIRQLPIGPVDQSELDAVLNNWGSRSAPDLNAAVVPEPALGLGVAALTVLRIRRVSRR